MENSGPRGHLESRRWISNEYHDLNGSHYRVLEKPPTALQFSRLAHISRPVVIKGFHVPASSLWTNEYLVDKMGERSISVAVTPNGRADAVTLGLDNKLYFTEPHVEKMTMGQLLETLPTGDLDGSSDQEIHYLQSQNGNMYSSRFFENNEDDISEFEPLRADVPSEVTWCSKAFDKPPDAVNVWIGDSRSVTSIHSDPYENIYTVIRGAKHFTLLPPTEGLFLKECRYPHATYTRSETNALIVTPSTSTVPPIRWSSISDPHLDGTLPSGAHPIHITIEAGETLYLPAGWWHHVRQSEGITIALNWWYDIEIQGMAWVWLSFLRGIGDVPLGNDTEVDEQEIC